MRRLSALACSLPTLLMLACASVDNVEAPPYPLLPPSHLTATPLTPHSIELRWRDNARTDFCFDLQRKGPGDSAFVSLIWVRATIGFDQAAWTDRGLPHESTFHYRVRSMRTQDECSGFSEAAVATTPSDPATVPEAALEHMRAAYAGLDLQHLEQALDAEFVFTFARADVVAEGAPASWDRAAELACATNMFSGQGPTTGTPASARSIEITLEPLTASWTADVPAAFAGTLGRSYFLIAVVRAGREVPVVARGQQDIYVARQDVDGIRRYRIRHWVDHGLSPLPGPPPPYTYTSWGRLKYGYRG